MAAHSQGIQTLLEAEKEAAKVVQQARQYRTQKLKDARSEAAKDLETYKAQKDNELKAFEQKVSWTTIGVFEKLNGQHLSTLAQPKLIRKLSTRKLTRSWLHWRYLIRRIRMVL
ncbi:H(+)-transporting V1 sector ATPase subunit G [Serendipita sp. 396]|nr:H(+)-transporting V1 sector ATPase subunit G [Serendipita sp. 396]